MLHDYGWRERRAPAPVPVWFGSSDRPRFGWWHASSGGTCRAAAVLCPPLGHELLKTYNSYRILAEELADRGVAVLRFDYDGTGDSAGRAEDPGRWKAWLASTADALALVRRYGANRVSLVGMTIGGIVATYAAAADGRVDRLVLWDAALSGRSYLHRHAGLMALSFGIAGRRPDGSVETPGYVFGPAAVTDMQGLRLDGMPGPVADSVLVLTPPEGTEGKAGLSALGRTSVDYGMCQVRAQLLEAEAPFQRVPLGDILAIADWMTADLYEDGNASYSSSPGRMAPTRANALVACTDSGLEIREQVVSIPPVGLFGIETRAPDLPPRGPVAVFLNSSDEHHIGPNRLWVDLARRWAAMGIDSFRIDLSGLGDSPVRRPGQNRLVTRAPEAFDDLEDAVRMASDKGRRAVILVGLCSSAYLAAESGLTMNPASVILLNPALRFPPPEVAAGGQVDPRRVIAQPRRVQGWEMGDERVGGEPAAAALKRFVARTPRLDQLGRSMRDLKLQIRWRWSYLLNPMSRPRRWCGLLTARNTNVLIVAGDDEHAVLRCDMTDRVLAGLMATGRFRYEHVPGLDHGIAQDLQRGAVSDVATEFITDRLASMMVGEGQLATSGEEEVGLVPQTQPSWGAAGYVFQSLIRSLSGVVSMDSITARRTRR